jgi:tight adherence protein B
MIPLVAGTAAALVVVLVGARRPVAWGTRAALVATSVVAIVLAVGASSELTLSLPLVVLAALCVWALVRELRRLRDQRRRVERSRVVVEICEGLAADLRAGLPPISALASAARDWSEFRLVPARPRRTRGTS